MRQFGVVSRESSTEFSPTYAHLYGSIIAMHLFTELKTRSRHLNPHMQENSVSGRFYSTFCPVRIPQSKLATSWRRGRTKEQERETFGGKSA